MTRYLSCCTTCDLDAGLYYVVHRNDWGGIVAFENVPEWDQDLCRKARPNIPSPRLFTFGGCPKCKKIGWPTGLPEKPYEGKIQTLF